MRLLKIGRDASNDIVLRSDKVSSLHAEITLMNSGDILLEDKGSRNGTFIMNQPIKAGKPVNVRRGDAIRFADVELQWSQVPMPEDNSAYKAIFGIGTNFNNDIQISGSTVSRYHATVKQARDGKMYIIDHSKNGTTVNGTKISPNNPYRIKKKSAVVCGGVPVDLSHLPWPSELWKTLLAAAATVLVLVGVGFGAYKLIDGGHGKYKDGDLFARYKTATAMAVGIYHYEVKIGDLDMKVVKGIDIPEKVFLWQTEDGSQIPIDISNWSQKDFIDKIKELNEEEGMYMGTAFFISPDGQLVTNLHVVKPWLFNNAREVLQSYYSRLLARAVSTADVTNVFYNGVATPLSAYVSQVKVEGVLDYIALIPQGEIYDADNVVKCRVLSAGEDTNKDVALIQTITKRLPTSDCTYVNVKDSMDVSDDALKVGEHMYTIGFPYGMNPFIQDKKNEKGIQAYSAGGSITQESSEFQFLFDASSFHGASGSPIFNDRGLLIGVLNSGLDSSQGFNKGIKAAYIKELLDSPHKQ